METKPELKWTKFLEPDQVMNDPYAVYKDGLLYQCEDLVGKITKEYLVAHPTMPLVDAKKMAISLILEQMLNIQYEHSPHEQAAMSAELFVHLPKLKDFRNDLVKEIKEKTGAWNKFKKFINKKCS